MRKRIFEIIEKSEGNDRGSRFYDVFMIVVIVVSLVPLLFKGQYTVLKIIDLATAAVFCLDYFLRLITADFKLQKGRLSFVRYPVTVMAIIDLLSILPSFTPLNASFRLLKLFRLFRALRVLRVLKAVRYTKSVDMLINVFRKQKSSLIVIVGFAVGYILTAALVIFNVEPETFGTFFDAIYWATVSLTTVGYGDIYPVSTIGKVITMVSSFTGIAIVAMPSGIITAGILEEMKNGKD